jgi:phage terminase large subunit-like protein
MRWEIGFDKKPYDKEYNIGTGNIEKTKAIAYIAFHPLERGEGVVAITSIYNIKRYFKGSRELLK